MKNTPSAASHAVVTLLNDDTTPWDFVIELLTSVFGKTEEEAGDLANAVNRGGQAVIGRYMPEIAVAFLRSARALIAERGYPLQLRSVGAGEDGPTECSFCGKPPRSEQALYRGQSAFICDDCLVLAAASRSAAARQRQFHYAHQALAWHFAGLSKEQIVSTGRHFPGHMRADVHAAINQLFAIDPIRFLGVHEDYRYETLTLGRLMKTGQQAPVIAPVEYEEVDIGEDQPMRCPHNGLWLRQEGELRYAVVVSEHREFGQAAGIRVEIAVPSGEAGATFSTKCFELIAAAVNMSRAYRGKVLSLEANQRYRGTSRGMTVHRLGPVGKDEVILPDATLRLLDRNIIDFAKRRDALRALGQPTRKGILLYGPPGTGKTHTIRYLASNLPGHTTLLITGGQVGLLAEYMTLARLLQPSMVVIEDVDLIARDRQEMDGPCEESLLNNLLNEMDGLTGDADILFVLTTNRPEQLEVALAGRPGRVDQAIEVPLPDEACRSRLVHLYGGKLQLDDSVVATAAKRCAGVSAAFIKEMMRRAAQANIERGGGPAQLRDIEQALDDMLFTGGKLNVRLLGGAVSA